MSDAWVYVLRCADGSLYTGWTVDLERRLASHSAGDGSRYTRSRLPVELVSRLAALSRRAVLRYRVCVARELNMKRASLLVAAGLAAMLAVPA